SDNRVRDSKKTISAQAVNERRYCNDRISRIKISPKEKPTNNNTESPSSEPPFVEQIQVAPFPTCCEKPEYRDDQKQTDKNGRSDPVRPSDSHFVLPVETRRSHLKEAKSPIFTRSLCSLWLRLELLCLRNDQDLSSASGSTKRGIVIRI